MRSRYVRLTHSKQDTDGNRKSPSGTLRTASCALLCTEMTFGENAQAQYTVSHKRMANKRRSCYKGLQRTSKMEIDTLAIMLDSSPANQLRKQVAALPSRWIYGWHENSVSRQIERAVEEERRLESLFGLNRVHSGIADGLHNEMLRMQEQNRLMSSAGMAGVGLPSEPHDIVRKHEEAHRMSGLLQPCGVMAGILDEESRRQKEERRVHDVGFPFERSPEETYRLIEPYLHAKPMPLPPPSTEIHFHGPVSHTMVGNENSVQYNVSADIDIGAVQRIIAMLKEDSDSLSLAPETATELEAEIQTLEAQAHSPRPKNVIIREALLSLRPILENAAGNLLSSAVLYEIGKLVH